jgi:hypothetical protein
MITTFIVLYILCWIYMIYSMINAPTDVELWGREVE